VTGSKRPLVNKGGNIRSSPGQASDYDPLPKGEEEHCFDAEEFWDRVVFLQWAMKDHVEKAQTIESIGDRYIHYHHQVHPPLIEIERPLTQCTIGLPGCDIIYPQSETSYHHLHDCFKPFRRMF